MPCITAATSFLSFRYGCVDTTVFKLEVIVIRPRETAPLPRYMLIVIVLPFGAPRLPSIRAVHWS